MKRDSGVHQLVGGRKAHSNQTGNSTKTQKTKLKTFKFTQSFGFTRYFTIQILVKSFNALMTRTFKWFDIKKKYPKSAMERLFCIDVS